MNENKIDDGGPAFPVPEHGGSCVTEHGETVHQFPAQSGLSLRDYFAAKAIDSNMLEAVEWYKNGLATDVYQRAATGAYRMADAMLAARKEGAK